MLGVVACRKSERERVSGVWNYVTGNAGRGRGTRGALSGRTDLGGGERDKVGGILWTAGREMKGRDRNFDRRASDIPQAGREGEVRQEVEGS